jgi:hypothetical protein
VTHRTVVLALLIVSAVALLAAPTVVGGDYSPVAHTTSESAAQGIPGAGVARSGFLLLGAAVLVLVVGARGWSLAARWSHGAFGVAMLATAAFSSRPWDPTASFDPTEDLLHSVAATAMGFAFALGVVARGVERRRVDLGDALAVVASVAIPLGMLAVDDVAGLLQRGMFLVAYLWFAREAVTLGRPAPSGT